MTNKIIKYLKQNWFGGVLGIGLFALILKFTHPSEQMIPWLFGPISLFVKSISSTCGPTTPDTIGCAFSLNLFIILSILAFWFFIGTVLWTIIRKLLK